LNIQLLLRKFHKYLLINWPININLKKNYNYNTILKQLNKNYQFLESHDSWATMIVSFPFNFFFLNLYKSCCLNAEIHVMIVQQDLKNLQIHARLIVFFIIWNNMTLIVGILHNCIGSNPCFNPLETICSNFS